MTMNKLLSIFIILFLSFGACNKDLTYKPLSKRLANEIMKKYEKEKPYHPIDLKGYTRNQLITFCVQTTPKESVKNWVDWAYKKIIDSIYISMKENVSISDEQVLIYSNLC